MKNPLIPWTIEIKDLMTRLRVGLLEHERAYQPIRVNLSIRAITPAFPQSIEECLNYQPICEWAVREWPKQPHTPLLETKILELMRFIFEYDARVEWIDAVLSKPEAAEKGCTVEIRMTASREEFEAAEMGESMPAVSYAYAD